MARMASALIEQSAKFDFSQPNRGYLEDVKMEDGSIVSCIVLGERKPINPDSPLTEISTNTIMKRMEEHHERK